MPYNSVIDRTDASTLIQEEYAPSIIKGTTEASAVMRMAKRLPNMPSSKTNMPVLSLLPSAYWVDGDTGLKQTSEVNWRNVQLIAKELAVIVPIPEAVLEDSVYDLWDEVQPLLSEAFGKAFDEAVLYGTNAPAGWPDDLVTGATNAGNYVVEADTPDRYQELLGEGGVVALVEADGYIPTGHIAAISMRAKLRGTTDTNGQPVFDRSGGTFDGNPIVFPKNGSMDPSKALMFSGDWNQLVFSIRKDITFKVLDQGVITDNTGAIVYNLAQQDMVALRAVMRLAWQLPNPVNRLNSNDSTRYPFAVYKPAP